MGYARGGRASTHACRCVPYGALLDGGHANRSLARLAGWFLRGWAEGGSSWSSRFTSHLPGLQWRLRQTPVTPVNARSALWHAEGIAQTAPSLPLTILLPLSCWRGGSRAGGKLSGPESRLACSPTAAGRHTHAWYTTPLLNAARRDQCRSASAHGACSPHLRPRLLAGYPLSAAESSEPTTRQPARRRACRHGGASWTSTRARSANLARSFLGAGHFNALVWWACRRIHSRSNCGSPESGFADSVENHRAQGGRLTTAGVSPPASPEVIAVPPDVLAGGERGRSGTSVSEAAHENEPRLAVPSVWYDERLNTKFRN